MTDIPFPRSIFAFGASHFPLLSSFFVLCGRRSQIFFVCLHLVSLPPKQSFCLSVSFTSPREGNENFFLFLALCGQTHREIINGEGFLFHFLGQDIKSTYVQYCRSKSKKVFSHGNDWLSKPQIVVEGGILVQKNILFCYIA